MLARMYSFFAKPVSSQQPTSFDDLPEDIAKEILQKLDLATIKKLYRLNQRMHNIIYQSFKSNPVLQPFYEKRDNDLNELYRQYPYYTNLDKDTHTVLSNLSYTSMLFCCLTGGTLFACVNHVDYGDLNRDVLRDFYIFLGSMALFFAYGVGVPTIFSYLADLINPFVEKQDHIKKNFLYLFKTHITEHEFVPTKKLL